MRFLDLTENLRLSDYQRVESRGDAEQVAGDIEIGDFIDMWLQRLAIDVVKVGDEVDKRRTPLIDVFGHAVQFRAIARREHDRLADRATRGERPQRRLEPARLKIDPLAQFDRRSSMTYSDENEMHKRGPEVRKSLDAQILKFNRQKL